MIDFFNRTLEVIVPKTDDEGNEIDNTIIYDSVQTLMSNTLRCSITETMGYHNFNNAISYSFKYLPKVERRDNNLIIHSLYTLISTMLLYNELDVVHINIDDDMYEFNLDDLEKLKFTLDKLLFIK